MMDRMNQHSIRVLPIVLLASMFLSGCGQSEIDGIASGGDANHYGEPVTLSISLQNAPEYNAPDNNSSATRSGEPLLSEWVGVNSFNMTRSSTEESGAPKIAIMELFEDTVPATARTRGAMTAGYYFRLIAFKKSGDDYLFHSVADYKVDDSSAPVLQQGKMELPAGQTYRFVAYSFNNRSELGALPDSYNWNSSSISIPDMGNDFMTFDSGEIAASGGKLPLAVSFKQQLCKLAVKISVTGFASNTFTNCTGVYIKQGGNQSTWIVGADAVTANTNNTGTFNIPDNNANAPIRLVPFAAARAITVHFGTLTVGGKAANNTDITSSQSVKLLPGKSYTMTVQFKRKIGIQLSASDINLTGNGCTESDKTDLAKLTWAVGNLKSTDNSKPYEMTTSIEEYGYYYTFYSSFTGSTSTNNTDPCSKLDATIYGSGWRTPSKNEFDKLVRCTDKVLTNGGMWFMNNTKGLFLPAAGYRGSGVGSHTTPTHNAGTGGYYWSSVAASSNAAYCLDFSSGNAVVGYTGSKSYGFSVRCVQGDKQ